MQPENPSDLATLRWETVRETLHEHGVADNLIKICGHHFKQGFVLGFKEGLEWENEDEEDPIGFQPNNDDEEEDDEETPG